MAPFPETSPNSSLIYFAWCMLITNKLEQLWCVTGKICFWLPSYQFPDASSYNIINILSGWLSDTFPILYCFNCLLKQTNAGESIPLSQLCLFYIPPISKKFINFPLPCFRKSYKFPPIFVQFVLSTVFASNSYFHHDAFMLYTFWMPLNICCLCNNLHI